MARSMSTRPVRATGFPLHSVQPRSFLATPTKEGQSEMELQHEFRVSVPVEQAWAVLTDLERVAPCMPGAQLQEVEGDEYRGIVRVKVGPITTQYKGVARFLERDEEHHT